MNPHAEHIYIAADLHLGVPDYATSLERERKFILWLETIRHQAQEIILLGDVFDFWFEYKWVVPKGYVRLLGKLAELTDSGIPISIFSGNHDFGLRDYFTQELNIPVYHKPIARIWYDKRYFIGHGDGLGPGDHGYKALKAVMRNPVMQWCFRNLHPDWGIGLADYFSRKSRAANAPIDKIDHGEQEYLYQFVKQRIATDDLYDYYIFGHRHLPRRIQMSPRTELLVLGDWINDNSYIQISPSGVQLLTYDVPTQ